MNRQHSLDGLRAVAASLVIAHHLGVAALANGLYLKYPSLSKLIGSLTASGVELFFVLSAVVLAGPYISGAKPFVMRTYAQRRIARLMPPYLAAWAVAGLAIYLSSTYPTWWTLGASLPKFTFADWFAQIGIVYFGSAQFNFAWWSLTTEVEFYMLLPLLIPCFRWLLQFRLGLQYALIASIFIATFATSISSQTNLPIVESILVYASCFCAGIVLSSYRPTCTTRQITLAVGVVWIIIACIYRSINIHVGWGMVYFSLVAIALDKGTVLARVLSVYPLVWLGERSYSLFLIHFSIIGLVCHGVSFYIEQKSPVYFVITRVLSLALSLLMAMFVFHFIERRTAHNLATGSIFWPRMRWPLINPSA